MIVCGHFAASASPDVWLGATAGRFRRWHCFTRGGAALRPALITVAARRFRRLARREWAAQIGQSARTVARSVVRGARDVAIFCPNTAAFPRLSYSFPPIVRQVAMPALADLSVSLPSRIVDQMTAPNIPRLAARRQRLAYRRFVVEHPPPPPHRQSQRSQFSNSRRFRQNI